MSYIKLWWNFSLILFWRDTLMIGFYYFIGYIDLSKRRVSPEEVTKCEEKFAKAKAVSFKKIICCDCYVVLWNMIAWSCYQEHVHSFDLKLIEYILHINGNQVLKEHMVYLRLTVYYAMLESWWSSTAMNRWKSCTQRQPGSLTTNTKNLVPPMKPSNML